MHFEQLEVKIPLIMMQTFALDIRYMYITLTLGTFSIY